MIIIGIVLSFVALAYLCWLLFALGSLCTSILRWRHCGACRLPQRLRTRRSDHRRRNCWQCRPRSRTDRFHKPTLTSHARRAGAASLPYRPPWPGIMRHADSRSSRSRGRLGATQSQLRARHRGGDGLHAHVALSPPDAEPGLLPA